MSLTAETVLILIGALFLLIGLLGGGIEISAIKVPTAGGPQRAVLGVIGVVMIVVGAKFVMDTRAQEQATPDAAQAASAASAAGPAAAASEAAPAASEAAPAASDATAPTTDPAASASPASENAK